MHQWCRCQNRQLVIEHVRQQRPAGSNMLSRLPDAAAGQAQGASAQSAARQQHTGTDCHCDLLAQPADSNRLLAPFQHRARAALLRPPARCHMPTGHCGASPPGTVLKFSSSYGRTSSTLLRPPARCPVPTRHCGASSRASRALVRGLLWLLGRHASALLLPTHQLGTGLHTVL